MRERIAKPRLDARRALVFLTACIEQAAQRGALRQLLEGLLSPRHRDELAQRLRVAQLLVAGYSYRGIEDTTSVSSKTIAVVDRWLRWENPHYRRRYPIRHKRRYHHPGRFLDAPLPISPLNTRALVNALFGMDPRQR